MRQKLNHKGQTGKNNCCEVKGMGSHLEQEKQTVKENLKEKIVAVQPEEEKTQRQQNSELPGENPPDAPSETEKIERDQKEAEQTEPQAEQKAAPEPEADVEELKRQLAEATAQAQEYFHRLVRLQADFDNYRKRALREREELLKFAAEELITQLLPVLDNFERALSFGRENADAFYEGVEMIYRQLCHLLKAQGLTPIPALGEKFDPSRHEAVAWEETEEAGNDNIIVEELRKGYYLKDKVIRPAMVKVGRAKQKEVQEGERVNG